jgi:hypothetical protein
MPFANSYKDILQPSGRAAGKQARQGHCDLEERKGPEKPWTARGVAFFLLPCQSGKSCTHTVRPQSGHPHLTSRMVSPKLQMSGSDKQSPLSSGQTPHLLTGE